ncbi:MAG: Fic family protein [Verrucomicrobiales bacterium]|nr:Fic family protein [Verrucomicrobiales bacterium]
MPFSPKFIITSETATALMRIEAAKEAVRHLPITPSVLASLRETARLFSTHYSTITNMRPSTGITMAMAELRGY